MNQARFGKVDAIPRLQLFKCVHATCGATFTRQWRLKEHETVHTGECTFQNCQVTFRKRRMLKLHLAGHGVSKGFRCSKPTCGMTFDTHVARKAHEKTHAGYCCPHTECQVVEHTWGKLQKHKAKHPASFSCTVCKKSFGKRDSLRRHKRSHALQKPVLLCPNKGCQAYFSTTFNLEHHIRKVHLQLLSHVCSFPGCTKAFAMRQSLVRHLLHHDPDASKLKQHKRSSKGWQKRLEGRRRGPLVEEDLRRLFALRMRISRKAKVEANLSSLFNERKIPHHVDPEVNLRDLFSIKHVRK
uniref:C2H2-type domain-containing protein n=1 Tax=Electrophorus electricus TaxID=8005 RepID=A0A4W4GCV0_ELEEL